MSSMECPLFHNTSLSEEFVSFPSGVTSLNAETDPAGPSLIVQQDGSVRLDLCFYDTSVINRMYDVII